MGLPTSVQQQSSMAEQLHQQRYGGLSDDQRDPGQPADNIAQPDGAGDVDPTDAPTANNNEHDADYWQRRFNTLQGKYNAEVTQVAQHNRDLQARVEQAEQRASDAEQKLEQTQADQPVELTEHFSQEEIDEYGEQTLRTMLRAGKKAAQPDIDRIRQDSDTRIESMQRSQFYDALTESVPDWSTINDDPAFHRWLEAESNRLDSAGNALTRQQVLSMHEQSCDARGVITMFNEFKQSRNQGGQRQPEAPPKAGGGGTMPASDNDVWVSRADIAQFYRDKPRWAKRDPDGCRAREQVIERAVQAGRVR